MTSDEDVLQRIYAGVLGKLIGVYAGRPFEGWTHQRIMERLGPVTGYVHERFGVPLVVTDDDIAGTFTFVRALAEHGYDPALPSSAIGDTWLNTIVEKRAILWWGGFGNSTEETAWRRLQAGVRAPESGSIGLNGRTIAEQIGAQIFIDGWALVSPGDPRQAARLARAAARVSHDGEAVHAATLLAAMQAQAFIERDLDRLLQVALDAIPDDCRIARIVDDVRGWAARHDDWRTTRARIEERYGYHLYPGNCHVVPNFAVVLMALLHGGDSFDRVMTIANTAGWDTDCNAGNVGCLTGIRLGLAGIDDGGVGSWREPVADRLLLSSADGGAAVSDAAEVALWLRDAGLRLRGDPPPTRPKAGARFHFTLPGSVQGFTAAEAGPRLRQSAAGLDVDLAGLAPGAVAHIDTPVFAPPEVGLMRTYELCACPQIHSGQTVRARLAAHAANDGMLEVRPCLAAYGADDRLFRLYGEAALLAPGQVADLAWTVPDLAARPAARVGIAARSPEGGAGVRFGLDRLDWDGAPRVALHRPAGRPIADDAAEAGPRAGRFWGRAWVNAVSHWSDSFGESFRLSQDAGTGLLIQGSRRWRDIRAWSDVAICLGGGGIALRVQGLRRYYALLLRPDRRAVLVKRRDGEERVLAEVGLDWSADRPVRLALAARNTRLVAEVGGETLMEAQDADRPLLDGAFAFVVETGTLSADRVEIEGA